MRNEPLDLKFETSGGAGSWLCKGSPRAHMGLMGP